MFFMDYNISGNDDIEVCAEQSDRWSRIGTEYRRPRRRVHCIPNASRV